MLFATQRIWLAQISKRRSAHKQQYMKYFKEDAIQPKDLRRSKLSPPELEQPTKICDDVIIEQMYYKSKCYFAKATNLL